MTKYKDMYGVDENLRIDAIGKAAASGQKVGVLLERDEPEKIERYISKITTRYPTVALIKRVNGPTPLVVTLQFGPKSTT